MAGGKDMMEELVKKLAELQADLRAEEVKASTNKTVITLREAVDDAARQLEAAKIALSDELISYESAIELIDAEIDDVSAQIIDAWNPDTMKKTIRTDAGTIKFRTTYSPKILDKQEPRVLENMLDHRATPEEIMQYLKGFNLTKLKAWMIVHPLPTDVAGLVSKTTVKLEVREAV